MHFSTTNILWKAVIKNLESLKATLAGQAQANLLIIKILDS